MLTHTLDATIKSAKVIGVMASLLVVHLVICIIVNILLTSSLSC